MQREAMEMAQLRTYGTARNFLAALAVGCLLLLVPGLRPRWAARL